LALVGLIGAAGAADARLAVVTRAGRPWWQLTTTPTFGFVAGGAWVVVAVGQWFALATGDARTLRGGVPWHVVLAAVSTMLAAMYLMSSVRLRRRLRAAREQGRATESGGT
jgi:hypothetical protein